MLWLFASDESHAIVSVMASACERAIAELILFEQVSFSTHSFSHSSIAPIHFRIQV
jgi:hypothetical protein